MRETRCGRKRRRQEAEEEARKAAGRRGDSKEGRQTGRQAAAEKGARRGMTESTSRTVYLTDFQDFRALNGFPSFSTPDSCGLRARSIDVRSMFIRNHQGVTSLSPIVSPIVVVE